MDKRSINLRSWDPLKNLSCVSLYRITCSRSLPPRVYCTHLIDLSDLSVGSRSTDRITRWSKGALSSEEEHGNQHHQNSLQVIRSWQVKKIKFSQACLCAFRPFSHSQSTLFGILISLYLQIILRNSIPAWHDQHQTVISVFFFVWNAKKNQIFLFGRKYFWTSRKYFQTFSTKSQENSRKIRYKNRFWGETYWKFSPAAHYSAFPLKWSIILVVFIFSWPSRSF